MSRMSYTITVTKRGETLTVAHSGQVPEGVYEVNGHSDEHSTQLSVRHVDHEGHQVASAGSHHSRE